MNKKNKIIIVNSHKYFGGTLVLSSLCRLLINKGYDARLFIVHEFPGSDTNKKKFWILWLRYNILYNLKKLLYSLIKKTKYARTKRFETLYINHVHGCRIQYNPFFEKKNTVVVYPEVVYGNFLKAKKVVRWLLYNYKYGENAYSNDDLFICYREIFNSNTLNPECKKVCISSFNNKIYYKYNFGDRKEKCYLLRKGKSRNDLPDEFDSEVIDDNTSECDIVRIFNEYKYCYFYDTQTYYAVIAAVCGCIPIIVLEKGKKRSDYLSSSDNVGYGIAYGDNPDEIEFAISTRENLLSSLDYTEINEFNVNKFIRYVEEYFSISLK